MFRRTLPLLGVCLALSLVAWCARTVPKDRAAASLYRDLQRLVGLAQTTGWEIDRIALQGLESNALQSVCRVPLKSRLELMSWLDARILAMGGPLEEAWRKRGNLRGMGEELVRGMVERGIEPAYARAVFDQILGFGEYGFPESHAASFALLVYVSGWLKCHHPAAFAAALINSQPMGFYSARALVADAQRHGVEVRPVCVRASSYDCTLEAADGGALAIRLGLRLVQGLGEEHAERIVAARQDSPFHTLADMARRTGLDRRRLQTLAEAGAFEEVSKGRRPAAWTLQGLWTDLPLFAHLEPTEPTPPLPALDAVDRLRSDYRTVGLSVDLHPIELIRSALEQLGCLRVGDLLRRRPGDRVRVAGLVSSRQRPGTASGVVFMTFEDETGMVNLVVWPKIWARFQKMARSRSLLGCDGRLQRQDDAISVLVERLWEVPEPPRPSSDEGGEAAPSIGSLPVRSHDFH